MSGRCRHTGVALAAILYLRNKKKKGREKQAFTEIKNIYRQFCGNKIWFK